MPELLDDWTKDNSTDNNEERILKITSTSTKERALVANPGDKALKNVHREKLEGTTG